MRKSLQKCTKFIYTVSLLHRFGCHAKLSSLNKITIHMYCLIHTTCALLWLYSISTNWTVLKYSKMHFFTLFHQKTQTKQTFMQKCLMQKITKTICEEYIAYFQSCLTSDIFTQQCCVGYLWPAAVGIRAMRYSIAEWILLDQYEIIAGSWTTDPCWWDYTVWKFI